MRRCPGFVHSKQDHVGYALGYAGFMLDHQLRITILSERSTGTHLIILRICIACRNRPAVWIADYRSAPEFPKEPLDRLLKFIDDPRIARLRCHIMQFADPT